MTLDTLPLEVGKTRGPRTGIWDTATFGGHGGKKEPAKETEKEQLTR